MIRDEWTVLPLPPPSKEYRENYDSIFRKIAKDAKEALIVKPDVGEEDAAFDWRGPRDNV